MDAPERLEICPVYLPVQRATDQPPSAPSNSQTSYSFAMNTYIRQKPPTPNHIPDFNIISPSTHQHPSPWQTEASLNRSPVVHCKAWRVWSCQSFVPQRNSLIVTTRNQEIWRFRNDPM